MTTYIALLRGINVGGKSVLSMKELASILEDVGCQKVSTYIQSGNAVFTSDADDASSLANRIREEIDQGRGLAPTVLVLTIGELEQAMAGNPFPEATEDPASLHLGFLATAPQKPDLATMESLRAGSERFRLIDRVFYLHAPDGVGRSKLAANAERLLGVAMTDRNWRTVLRLLEMARGLNLECLTRTAHKLLGGED